MHDARVLYMYLASPRRFAQVSSLKSQVSSPSGLPKSQVSSLKSQVFVSFFHFFFISCLVYLRLQYREGQSALRSAETSDLISKG